jgi:hypothetical protein
MPFHLASWLSGTLLSGIQDDAVSNFGMDKEKNY